MSRVSIIEKLKEGMTSVHCKTVDQAKEFIKICYVNGINQRSSIVNMDKTHWNDYKERTCYRVRGDALNYASYFHYESEDYEIITFEEFMEEYNMKEFTKADLKTGMIVVTRAGIEYIVVKGMEHDFDSTRDLIVNTSKRTWDGLEFYTNDLLNNSDMPEMDIMEVYLAPHPHCMQSIDYKRDERKLLWKREEVKELTVDEISKLLGYKVRVVGGNK